MTPAHKVITTDRNKNNNSLSVLILLTFFFNIYHVFEKMSRKLKRFTDAKKGTKKTDRTRLQRQNWRWD
jgi:hypothetical protein